MAQARVAVLWLWWPLGLISWCGLTGGPSTELPPGRPSCGFYMAQVGVGSLRLMQSIALLCLLHFSILLNGNSLKDDASVALFRCFHTQAQEKPTFFASTTRGKATPSLCFHLSPFLPALFSQTHVTHQTPCLQCQRASI